MKKGSLSKKVQIEFFQKLSSLMKADIPLTTAMELLKHQSTLKNQRLYTNIITDISSGKSLAHSLEEQAVFAASVIAMINTGEKFSRLQKNIDLVTEDLQKQEQLKRSIVSAFIYPGFIATATGLLSAFLLLYIFPKIQPVLLSLSVSLPLTTRILITISTFLQQNFISIIILCLCVPIGIWYSLKHYKNFQLLFEKILFRIPIVGSIIIRHEVIQMFKILGLVYGSGAPIETALKACTKSLSTLNFRNLSRTLHEDIQLGKTFSKILEKRSDIIPLTTIQLVAIAETTGTLASTSLVISDLYSQEIQSSVKRLSEILEPSLMIIMGCIVGFISLAMITPIYTVSQNLQR